MQYVTLFQHDKFEHFEDNILRLAKHRENASYWNEETGMIANGVKASQFNLTDRKED